MSTSAENGPGSNGALAVVASAQESSARDDARQAREVLPNAEMNDSSDLVPEWIDRQMLAKDIYYREVRYVGPELLENERDPRVNQYVNELTNFVYANVISRVHLGWDYVYGITEDPRDENCPAGVNALVSDEIEAAAYRQWPDEFGLKKPMSLHDRIRRAAVRHATERLAELAFAIPGSLDSFACSVPSALLDESLSDEERNRAWRDYVAHEYQSAAERSHTERARLIDHWASEREFWTRPAMQERMAWERSISGGAHAS